MRWGSDSARVGRDYMLAIDSHLVQGCEQIPLGRPLPKPSKSVSYDSVGSNRAVFCILSLTGVIDGP
eukprot:7391545-Prymnesium_polylepis.2